MNQTIEQFLTRFKAAHNKGTPVIAIETPHDQALIARILPALGRDVPVIEWDLVLGARGLPKFKGDVTGIRAAQQTFGQGATPAQVPVDFLTLSLDLPPRSLSFMKHVHNLIGKPSPDSAAVHQAIANTVEPNKRMGRTTVLLGPVLSLPPELAPLVATMEEPPTTDADIAEVLAKEWEAANTDAGKPVARIPELSEETRLKVVRLCRGLVPFSAGQAIAESWRPNTPLGLDFGALEERKYSPWRTPGASRSTGQGMATLPSGASSRSSNT